MFSLNSRKNIMFENIIRTYNLLYKRLGCSVIYQIPRIHWISIPFRENSIVSHSISQCIQIQSQYISRTEYPENSKIDWRLFFSSCICLLVIQKIVIKLSVIWGKIQETWSWVVLYPIGALLEKWRLPRSIIIHYTRSVQLRSIAKSLDSTLPVNIITGVN